MSLHLPTNNKFVIPKSHITMANIPKETILLQGEKSALLTEEALLFLAKLHRTFQEERLNLLHERIEKQHNLDRGQFPTFYNETEAIRRDMSWKGPVCPKDLEKRWTEITGPAEKKMIINALNSGADVFMADFEDAISPTWHNIIKGQEALFEAVRKKLTFTGDGGKTYVQKEHGATLVVRPRGWHLYEKHLLIDGTPISASLFDFGLYFFHNAKELLKRGTGPYFYLPKIEYYLEADLWAKVFAFSEKHLGIPHGSIRASVLIETITAAFQMEEIIYALREYIAALNAGRWDYLFSIIKKFAMTGSPLFPDRIELTMNAPFMRAYTKLLIATCHKRGIHAIGGMSAFIPSRKEEEINKKAFSKVYEDKKMEADAGFDGAWIAHPDLLSIARKPFEERLKLRPHQIFIKEPVLVSQFELLNFSETIAPLTEKGTRHDIRVALKYLSAWLAGQGAVGIDHLMEDTATCEISRSHLWQLVHFRNVFLNDRTTMSFALFKKWLQEETLTIQKEASWPDLFKTKLKESADLLERLTEEFKIPEFITLAAYESLEPNS